MSEIDQLSVNTIRFLALDAVEKANSGHPGAPLGCAPMAYVLFNKLMKHNPANAKWWDRDRFVLSNGHASALLYSVLHLSGYDVTIEDLKSFRQWHSRTPGHPERGDTEGVEVTTGPLGQGLAMACGMAAAEKHIAARYNQPGLEIVDHYTFAMCGDGDLMEGISHEAGSLAGTLGLGKLIVLYDDNLISLDGPTELSFTEDVEKRFAAYHWQVLRVHDGNDIAAIEAAIAEAKKETNKPTLIAVRTVIGYGSPKAGTSKVHGEPLSAAETVQTKETLGWPADKFFYVPEEAAKHWATVRERGGRANAAWDTLWAKYKAAQPALAVELELAQKDELAAGWEKEIPVFGVEKPMATRNAGNQVMNAIAAKVPQLFGGAADLTSSTKTIFKDSANFHVDPAGRNVFFGVREFGMCAMVNGMAAHGGLVPFGSTFFVFSDYCRPALRLAALMQVHALFIFTHDSIGLGEDGPTHQPVEQIMSLRVIPGMTDFHPADANETAAAWRLALERKSPCFMALSRQDLPVLDAAKYKVAEGVPRGGYVLEDGTDVALAACGSEVSLAMKAAAELKAEGVNARVVSLPSWKIFAEQTAEYRESVLPKKIPKLGIEAGATLGWWKYVDDVVGLDRFGASAPGATVMDKLGFNVANVVEHAKKLIGK